MKIVVETKEIWGCIPRGCYFSCLGESNVLSPCGTRNYIDPEEKVDIHCEGSRYFATIA